MHDVRGGNGSRAVCAQTVGGSSIRLEGVKNAHSQVLKVALVSGNNNQLMYASGGSDHPIG